MTKIDNIRRWLKEIDTDIDPFTVSSHGLHLGTLEYPIDRYKLSDLSLDVSMPPLIINEARIIGERKLHLILPNLTNPLKATGLARDGTLDVGPPSRL